MFGGQGGEDAEQDQAGAGDLPAAEVFVAEPGAEGHGYQWIDVGVAGDAAGGFVFEQPGVGGKGENRGRDQVDKAEPGGSGPLMDGRGNTVGVADGKSDEAEEGAAGGHLQGGADHLVGGEGKGAAPDTAGAPADGAGEEDADGEVGLSVAAEGWCVVVREQGNATNAEGDAGEDADGEALVTGDEPFCEEDPDRHGRDDDGGKAGVEALLGPEEAAVIDGEHDEAKLGGVAPVGGGGCGGALGAADGEEQEAAEQEAQGGSGEGRRDQHDGPHGQVGATPEQIDGGVGQEAAEIHSSS